MVQYPVRSLLLSSGSWCTKILFVPPRLESLFPLVLWKSYNQIQPAFKVRFPEGSHPLMDPQAGKPDVGSEPSQQYENFFGIIVVKFVGHPPSRHGIWFYHGYAPLTVSLQFLCFWMWGLSFFFFFWWAPASSCWWLFNSCNFGVLTGGDEHMSYSAILNWKSSLLLFFFNWRKLSLWCCVDFCFTTTWIRHDVYIYIYTSLSSWASLPSPVPPL